MASAIVQALLQELTDEDRAELARQLRPFLPLEDAKPAAPDRWITSQQAAAYLGITKAALDKLAAARAVPFEQDTPGGKRWFKASELDAWRRGERQQMAA